MCLSLLRPALLLNVALAAVGSPASAQAPAASPSDGPRFNREIRPILSDKCFFCHGPDSAKRKSGLRLDMRDAAIKAGAIVPGHPEESELWKRITTKDGDDLMPPPDSHKGLKPTEIETLRRWIAAGAPYEPHWAYVAVVRPPAPAAPLAQRQPHPIDAFVQDRLRQAGVKASEPTDRQTLLRRLSLDLTGLPPTPAELRSFAAETRPDAVERQIDKLLRSPAYGERMAVSWLDVVRFADTVGYHGDQNQHVFPYRDYVIDAFNKNKRFDQFTVEQVAGDLLPKPSTEQLVASGFNRLNMVTREGGAQPGEYLAKYMADRVRAVGAAWLGSTVGCAQCHDHKYDPIEAKDFYALGAFFSDIREWGVYADYPYTPNPDLKGVGNDDPFPPEIMVRSAFLERRAVALGDRSRKLLRQLTAAATKADPKRRATWLQNSKAFLKRHPDGWEPLKPTLLPLPAESKIKASVDSTGLVLLQDKAKAEYWEHLSLEATFKGLSGPLASLRLDLVPHAEHKGSHLRGGNTRGQLSLSAKILRKGQQIKLRFHGGQANAYRDRWQNGHLQPDIKDGWRTPTGFGHDRLSGVWELASAQNLEPDDELVIRVTSPTLGAFSLSRSPFASLGSSVAPSPFGRNVTSAQPAAEPNAVAAYLRGSRAPNDEGVNEIYTFSGGGIGLPEDPLSAFRAAHQQWLLVKDGTAPTLVTVAQKPRVTRVLPRGNWQDETGAEVAPAVLHFLPQLPAAASSNGRRPTRLDLARWLTSRQNPLTARAFVNRLWKQFFGTGLSAVLDDLGGQGEPPTHPELLDWLAAEFMDSGWNVKHMVKLLTMSATYQQDSTARANLMAVDPQNRLLARQSQRRLDAEFVRDNALFVSGLLNLQQGGPSVFPYQPEGYYDNLEFPQRPYTTDVDEQQYRRGVYMHWQRTFVHPMLANFDAPSREECTADRPLSNTPQQALTLLNDPTFVEAAQALARKLLRTNKGKGATTTAEERLAQGFELVSGRTPDAEELRALSAHLNQQLTYYRAHPEEAAMTLGAKGSALPKGATTDTAAAWTSVCRVLLNMYETITRI